MNKVIKSIIIDIVIFIVSVILAVASYVLGKNDIEWGFIPGVVAMLGFFWVAFDLTDFIFTLGVKNDE